MIITLGLAVSLSCSVDLLSDVAVDISRDTLAGVLTVVLVGLTDISVGVLVDANLNMFAVMRVKFVLSVEGFSC